MTVARGRPCILSAGVETAEEEKDTLTTLEAKNKEHLIFKSCHFNTRHTCLWVNTRSFLYLGFGQTCSFYLINLKTVIADTEACFINNATRSRTPLTVVKVLWSSLSEEFGIISQT